MQYYFKIQARRIYRKIEDFGINPIMGILLTLALFLGGSFLLYNLLLEYATYIYLIIAFSYLMNLAFIQKREFLKLTLSKNDFNKLRLLENLMVALPFLFFLIWKQELIGALGLLIGSVAFAFIELRKSIALEFNTPFSSTPFEFSRGFRKSFLVYLIAYGLSTIAICFDNVNLGFFSILILGLTCGHFHSPSEPEFYVWNFNERPKRFLWIKIRIATVQQFFSVLPIICSLFIVFPDQVIYLFVVSLVMQLFLITNLLLKYAHFPKSIELIQLIVLPIILLFPPMMLVLIPFYFSKASQQLTRLTQ